MFYYFNITILTIYYLCIIIASKFSVARIWAKFWANTISKLFPHCLQIISIWKLIFFNYILIFKINFSKTTKSTESGTRTHKIFRTLRSKRSVYTISPSRHFRASCRDQTDSIPGYKSGAPSFMRTKRYLVVPVGYDPTPSAM